MTTLSATQTNASPVENPPRFSQFPYKTNALSGKMHALTESYASRVVKTALKVALYLPALLLQMVSNLATALGNIGVRALNFAHSVLYTRVPTIDLDSDSVTGFDQVFHPQSDQGKVTSFAGAPSEVENPDSIEKKTLPCDTDDDFYAEFDDDDDEEIGIEATKDQDLFGSEELVPEPRSARLSIRKGAAIAAAAGLGIAAVAYTARKGWITNPFTKGQQPTAGLEPNNQPTTIPL